MSRPLRVFREDDRSRAEESQFSLWTVPESAFDDSRLQNSDIRVLGVLTYLARMSFPLVNTTEKDVAARAGLSHGASNRATRDWRTRRI